MADEGSQKRKPDFRTAVAVAKALAMVLAMEAESILGRRTARFLGVLALFALMVGTLLALLDWYIAPTDANQKQDLIVTLAQILGGAALLSGLYFTWRTLQVNREGQITDRFTRAIDQLGKTDNEGNKLFEIRLGGIYALERIARESEEDYWPIVEVLTAYVRQHAPLRPDAGQGGEVDAAVEEKSVEDPSGASGTTELPTPEPDIQAIMTVLRRRTRSYGHGEPEPLDLHGTNLSGADLSDADLSEAILWDADLSKAMLADVNLSGADLSGANLSARGAMLLRANLWRANLWRANLSEAMLWEVNLSEAMLMGANLSGASLKDANLSGAKLWNANLSEAKNLTQEQLQQTIGDERTKLPSDLKPPAHWGVKTDGQIGDD